MRVLVALGTRPEIVKLAPVVAALRRCPSFEVRVVATGQHHDDTLAGNFFRDLGTTPDVTWELPADEAPRVAGILERAMEEIAQTRPDLVLLLGDTYTVPLFCLAARRYQVPIAHLEAGLRSFNETSMEEVNRKVAASTASLHLAPTEMAAGFLRHEGVPADRIRVVGNPIIDVLRGLDVRAEPPDRRVGVVMTVHRATNVDDPKRLEQVVRCVEVLASQFRPLMFPLHPRTRSRLDAQGCMPRLRRTGAELTAPLPYPAMLSALARCKVIVTDSGGLQEEAAWLGIPVVVLRRTTPRWEGVQARAVVLAGLDQDLVLSEVSRFSTPAEQMRVAAIPCPYGDGHTAEAVVELLADPELPTLLRWRETAMPEWLLAG